ncbi:MAG: TIM barrel protein [Blastocatellia bacterium]|nr:TIM barrel protein [Blastocatellia bacterium]
MNHPTRRDLLKFLASSVVAASVPTFSAPVKTPRIRWAQGYLLWRNFKGQPLKLQDALNDLRAVGADGIEFSPQGSELERNGLTTETFRQLMTEKKLMISGNYLSAPFYDPTKREEILQEANKRFALLKEFGGKNVIIGPPGVKADVDRPQFIKQQAPLLNEIGKRAKDQGLQIGIHPHLNTLVETPSEIDLAMETTDPRYVHFSADTGHIHLAGGDVPAILRKYKSRLNYFHFKDGVRPFVRPNFTPNLRELGRGEVNFPVVMKLLKEIRFTGWINIEQDTTTLTPQESCRISMEYVNKMLKPIYT